MEEKTYFRGGENNTTAQRLRSGETCIVVGIGNSMTPILRSGQPVLMEPVTEETTLEKGDIVLAKVRGNFYCHKITGTKPSGEVQVSNNHGHVNGWVNRNSIYGKAIKIM